MTKFKVGDKVQVKTNLTKYIYGGGFNDVPKGSVGKIIEYHDYSSLNAEDKIIVRFEKTNRTWSLSVSEVLPYNNTPILDELEKQWSTK